MLQINSDALLKNIGAQIASSTTALGAMVAGLFTGFTGGSTVLTRQTALADLVEASFDGYTRSSMVSLGTIERLPGGGWGFVGDRKQFVAGANQTSPGEIVVGGFLLQSSSNTTLLAAGLFDNGIAINNPGDAVNWNPSFTVVFDTDYSQLPGPAT